MGKKIIKYLGMICSCFILFLVLPITVKADEMVSGGAACEEATEVQFGIEYTTDSSEGWFKVYAPENLLYLGAGYDEFTSIEAYDENEERIFKSSKPERLSQIKLGEETSYWDSHDYGYRDFDLDGNCYYYFKVTTSKAEYSKFKLVYGAYPSSENRKAIQLRQDYTDSFYLASTFYPPMDLNMDFIHHTINLQLLILVITKLFLKV